MMYPPRPSPTPRPQRWALLRPAAGLLILGLLLPLTASRPAGPDHERAEEPAPGDLGVLFEPGGILQDRNGDGHIDYLDVRLVLGGGFDAAVKAAAAEIAARLGYETMSFDPGLAVAWDRRVRRWEQPVVLVGLADDHLPLPAAAAPLLAGLGPGQGVLLALAPDETFPRGGAIVTGRDETGLLTAAGYLAARFPSVWRLDGTAWSEVGERVGRLLAQQAVPAAGVRLEGLVVDAFRDGIVRARVGLDFVTAGALDSARTVLEKKVPTSGPGRTTRTTRTGAPDTTSTRSTRTSAADTTAAVAQNRRERILTITDLEFTDLHRLELHLTAPRSEGTVDLLPRRPWPARSLRPAPAGPSPDFSLARLFEVGGLLRDSDQDWIPDQTMATILSDGTPAPFDLIDLAARIGLETAGIRLPLVRVVGQDERPARSGFPILYGTGRMHADRLARDRGITDLPAEAGVGYLRFVPEGFDGRNGLLLGGTDGTGLAAVTGYAATRMPWLWEYGKGNWQLVEVEDEVRRFFQARSAAGQVSLGLEKLDTWLNRLEGDDLAAIEVEMAAEQTPEELDGLLEELVKKHFPQAQTAIEVHPTGFGVGRPVFKEEVDFPWEVDTVRQALRDEVLPRLTPKSRGRIEIRISESPEVREQLAGEIRSLLTTRGVPDGSFDIEVLCAYKQGYSWLHDRVLPHLRDREVGRIEITYHTLRDSEEVRWQTIASATRWLQELYPIDAVLARELDIPDSLVTFHPTYQADPVYRVKVFDPEGGVLLEDTFDPRYVVRPFFDRFPEYESIRVTTGWLRVQVGSVVLLDRRIVTDPESFWDHLQSETYGKVIDYVMDLQEGRPSSNNAPYFDELRVDLTLSEPDYRLGVDEEVISSLEALHEDIYFETLTLFNRIGARWDAGSMSYPGRILPYLHQGAGAPGRARISLTGKERARPELVLTTTARGGEPERQRYALSDPGVPDPVLRGLEVEAGAEGVRRLLFEVTATDTTDRYEEYRDRSSEAAIDRTFRSTTLLEGMVGRLTGLHRAGLFEQDLAFDRVESLRFRITLEDSLTWCRLADLPRSRHPRDTTRPVLLDRDFRNQGQQIVPWEEPLDPAEAEAILARLNTFPDVRVWWAARSFLGHDVWVADLHPRLEGRLVSQAKLNALRPTLYLTGRQHANEISSTSHLLRLAELLASDPEWNRYLQKVNVVIHPVTNPDGAWLVDELHPENPDFMLHAGYLGALGVDATSGSRDPDGRYAEARVRPAVQAMWLPDIMLDLHGYPSHEWVQYFAGYSAWVRGRSGGQRSWWSPRGWFLPGFSWVDDERYPEITRAQFAVLDSLAAAITGQPEVDAMNRRLYARYAKYGRQDVEDFREYFHEGILVYQSLRGRRVSGNDPGNPRITWFSATTETPDELARGEWLGLMGTAGLAHTSALVRYLYDGEFETERETEEYQGGVLRKVNRKRPVLPAEKK